MILFVKIGSCIGALGILIDMVNWQNVLILIFRSEIYELRYI